MVLNPEKYSSMPFGVKDQLQANLVSNNFTSENKNKEKVLVIIFDNKLEFSTHQTSITKKVNIKLNAITRV